MEVDRKCWHSTHLPEHFWVCIVFGCVSVCVCVCWRGGGIKCDKMLFFFGPLHMSKLKRACGRNSHRDRTPEGKKAEQRWQKTNSTVQKMALHVWQIHKLFIVNKSWEWSRTTTDEYQHHRVLRIVGCEGGGGRRPQVISGCRCYQWRQFMSKHLNIRVCVYVCVINLSERCRQQVFWRHLSPKR